MAKHKVGSDAYANFSLINATFDADINVGTLFALSKTEDNKGVVADKTLDTPAVGFIYEGSKPKFGEAYADNPDRPLFEGDSINIQPCGRYVLDEDTFTAEEVATRIPLYEGTAGAWTKVKPTTGGDRVRVVGFPLNKRTIWFDFLSDPVGEVI